MTDLSPKGQRPNPSQTLSPSAPLRLKEHAQEGTENQEVSLKILLPINDKEVTLIIPQEKSCLNKTWLNSTNRHANLKRGSNETPLLDEELQVINDCWEMKNSSPPEACYLMVYPILSISPENTHTSNTKENSACVSYIFINLHTYGTAIIKEAWNLEVKGWGMGGIGDRRSKGKLI